MMRAPYPHSHAHSRGVTLMELLIVVTIIGIISAVALPQYQQHLAKSRRVDTGTVLSSAATFMQQLQETNNGSYQRGGAAPELPVALRTSPPNATGNAVVYNITVTTPTPNTFLLTATPRAEGPMGSDGCGNLTLDQRGRKGVTGSGKKIQDCWK